jgi:hypothetical protein
MKSESMGNGTQHNNEELKELLKETRETVARDEKQEQATRSFGSVDMWNRQKRQRTSQQMRRWIN